ncbi:MAG TPA: Lrp/AsnC family transcriptional regulator [Armatimonadota bacterium]|jgi:DNA-binding Lrp family transcriptional regulator
MEDVLKILESDCRVTPETIASMTGRTVEEVDEIISDCEERGIIHAYKAVVDWDRVGDDRVVAFIDVTVAPERGTGFDDLAHRIYRFPEVRSVYLVSGLHDLRVVVAGKSIKEVAFFVAEKLSTFDRVQSTSTHFLLKTYKSEGVIFDAPEMDRRLAVAP